MRINPAIDDGMQSLSPRATFFALSSYQTVAPAGMPQSIYRSHARACRRNLICPASCACMTTHAGYYILTPHRSLFTNHREPILPV
jgi:hypothetical protein